MDKLTSARLRDIAERVGYAACYEQLAEEAAELAAACSKAARILRGDSPTPANYRDAKTAVFGEIADVRLCANVVLVGCLKGTASATSSVEASKLERWESRLGAAGK